MLQRLERRWICRSCLKQQPSMAAIRRRERLEVLALLLEPFYRAFFERGMDALTGDVA